ncbi:MAG: hypothetical protein M9904_02835 [Chitinophagaceae bacterium]|nr:hypothetical protein [Chitinophagaceae bacterium]
MKTNRSAGILLSFCIAVSGVSFGQSTDPSLLSYMDAKGLYQREQKE